MKLVTDKQLTEVHITVELDESGDVALLANGKPILWVMSSLCGIRFNTCDSVHLSGLGFRMDSTKVANV